jgi:hypothetical protein
MKPIPTESAHLGQFQLARPTKPRTVLGSQAQDASKFK